MTTTTAPETRDVLGAYRNLLARAASAKFYVTTHTVDYSRTLRFTGRELVRLYAENADRLHDPAHLAAFAAAETPEAAATAVVAALNALTDYYLEVETPAEREAAERERQMAALEPTVCEVQAKSGTRFGTAAFLDALEREIEGEEERNADRRLALREDGLCAGYGADHDAWWDDYNATPDRLSRLTALWDYCERFCPLLMASRATGAA